MSRRMCYCPACGKWFRYPMSGNLSPGHILLECSHCKTWWKVRFEYEEVEK